MQDHTWVESSERRSPFGTLSVCDVRMRPDLRTRHEHGELHLCFVLDGALEHGGGNAATMGPASARLSPAGARADLRFGPDGARCFLIHLEGLEPADATWLTPARPTSMCQAVRNVSGNAAASTKPVPAGSGTRLSGGTATSWAYPPSVW